MGSAKHRKSLEEIEKSIGSLEKILARSEKYKNKFGEELKKINSPSRQSAENLLAYLALRRKDIRKLQSYLGSIGVSRLARAESHVVASVKSLLRILYALRDGNKLELDSGALRESKARIKTNAESLFGSTSNKRFVRIMVTIPTEAAFDDGKTISEFLKAGMNVARVNCAHDSPEVWSAMIHSIRTQSKELDIPCKITMDLAGPKIRTGQIKAGPAVLKVKPNRNELGEVVEPGHFIVSTTKSGQSAYLETEVDLSRADEIKLRDTRGNKRSFFIKEYDGGQLTLRTNRTVYIKNNVDVKIFAGDTKLGKGTVSGIPELESSLSLATGDLLKLERLSMPGENVAIDENGETTSPAFVSVMLPQVLDEIKVDEPILFDDGKIGGTIRKIEPDHAIVEITFAPPGAKLKADKGINFPESQFSFSGLTPKDEKDLVFVAKHADMVNLSFVNDISDLDKFFGVLSTLKVKKHFGLILKIETRRGFLNLPALLLNSMSHYPIGVMIARGDLAVECGWQQLAEVQEEIRRICEAAHIPVIWATQVLEGLAKRGLPSRAEITDVSASQQAECVMLNKGPYMIQTIKTLAYILTQLQGYGIKQTRILPSLKMPSSFWID
ncbi:MAG: pyruvate kinase [Bacteroidota bacterium]